MRPRTTSTSGRGSAAVLGDLEELSGQDEIGIVADDRPVFVIDPRPEACAGAWFVAIEVKRTQRSGGTIPLWVGLVAAAGVGLVYLVILVSVAFV